MTRRTMLLAGALAGALVLHGCDDATPDSSTAVPAGGSARGSASTTPPAGARTGLREGNVAPDWTAQDASGATHQLSSYRGNVVVMDFWATWCPPCRVSMPGLQRIHEEFADRGVVIIGMNGGEYPNGDPVGYMSRNGLTYLSLLRDWKSIV